MTLFDQDTKSVETAPGVFAATVTGNWSVNGNLVPISRQIAQVRKL